MTNLEVIPEALLGASAQVDALTVRMIAANAVHLATTASILPPGSDPVSIKAAAALIGHGTAHAATATMGNEELLRSGVGVAETAVSYLTGDSQGAAAFGAAAV